MHQEYHPRRRSLLAPDRREERLRAAGWRIPVQGVDAPRIACGLTHEGAVGLPRWPTAAARGNDQRRWSGLRGPAGCGPARGLRPRSSVNEG